MWDKVFPRTFSCILMVFVIVLKHPTRHPFWWPNGLKYLLQHILNNDSHGCCWLVGLTSTELEPMHVHATTYPYGSANVYPCPSDAQGAKKEITPECLYYTKTLTWNTLVKKNAPEINNWIWQLFASRTEGIWISNASILMYCTACITWVLSFFKTLYRFTMNQPWFAKTGPLLTFLLGPGSFLNITWSFHWVVCLYDQVQYLHSPVW